MHHKHRDIKHPRNLQLTWQHHKQLIITLLLAITLVFITIGLQGRLSFYERAQQYGGGCTYKSVPIADSQCYCEVKSDSQTPDRYQYCYGGVMIERKNICGSRCDTIAPPVVAGACNDLPEAPEPLCEDLNVDQKCGALPGAKCAVFYYQNNPYCDCIQTASFPSPSVFPDIACNSLAFRDAACANKKVYSTCSTNGSRCLIQYQGQDPGCACILRSQ